MQLGAFDNSTPLMIACQSRHENIVSLLLSSKADPNLQNNMKFTALILATRQQLAKSVDLLSSGANPNLPTKTGWTALMSSCVVQPVLKSDDCIPVLLLSAGANINVQNFNDGLTALIVAVRYGYEAGIKILLNAQALVDIQDRYGNMALHHAAMIGHLVIIELLLSAGANRLLINTEGKTAMDVALDFHSHEACQFLLSHTQLQSAENEQSELPLQRLNIASHQELEKLRMVLRYPLSPAGTTKLEQNTADSEISND